MEYSNYVASCSAIRIVLRINSTYEYTHFMFVCKTKSHRSYHVEICNYLCKIFNIQFVRSEIIHRACNILTDFIMLALLRRLCHEG